MTMETKEIGNHYPYLMHYFRYLAAIAAISSFHNFNVCRHCIMYGIDNLSYKLFGNKIDYDLFDDTLFHIQSCVFKYPSVAFFNQLPLVRSYDDGFVSS